MARTPGIHSHPHPDHSPGPQAGVTVCVAVGGAAGSLCRYGAEQFRPDGMHAFPWTIIVVNLLGCFLMGVLMMALKERFTGAPAYVNPMLGTGFLGGFTTFSHYIDGTRVFIGSGQVLYAVGNLLLTLVATLGGVVLGVLVGRRLFVSEMRGEGRSA